MALSLLAVPMRNKQRGPVPPREEMSEPEFAFTLHKIALAALPNKTPVNSVPSSFSAITRGQPFPIPPERIPPGPEGLASILSAAYHHILNFTQNREGQIFMSPIFPPETTMEKIRDVLVKARGEETAPKAAAPKSAPAPKPAPLDPSTVFSQHSESVNLLARGICELLRHRTDIGEAESIDGLRAKISENFYSFFKLPLSVAGSRVPVDPILILEKFQGALFSRIMEEPVTGGVFVKPLAEAPAAPAVSKPPASRLQSTLPAEVNVSAVNLRAQLARSLDILDAALSGTKKFEIPDPVLWKNALETLLNQENQAVEVLANLFPE